MKIKKLRYPIELIFVMGLWSFSVTKLHAQAETESRSNKILTSFDQEKSVTVYENLGFFKKYKNTLSFYNHKMQMSFSGSHVVQGLGLTSKLPDIQLQGKLEFTYTLKPKLDIYAFGKYLGNPINNGGMSQTYMNPLFEQSEIGMGIKTEFHNIEFDMGPKLIIDTQSLNSNNSLRINTKISKKF